MKSVAAAIAFFILIAAAPAAEPWKAADLNPVTQHEAPKHEPLLLQALFVNKVTAPADAVQQLQSCIQSATGAPLPTVEQLDDHPTLVIGDCDQAKAAGLEGAKCPAEGFVIKTVPNRVFIVGNGLGLAWGVYEFAERYVGARWYFPADAGRFVPASSAVTVPPAWIEDHPVFPKREIWPATGEPWHGAGTDLRPVQSALRSADTWPHHLQVHTPDWSKVGDYTHNRPQVFQLTEAGKRDNFMLCYSNPRTLKTYLQNIEKAVAGDPSAHVGFVGDTITVSPNDAEVACYCPDCRALWNNAGGSDGAASKVVATFTSKLAAEVQQRWPKLTVLQLAYFNYTDPPEGVTFPPNVEVQLCGMPGMAMYKEPQLYAHEQQNVAGWMKLTGKKVQNWHYTCWPEDRTKAVFAYPHIVHKYYRGNRDKTVGTFINGEGDHWPRQHLSLYCWMKVLWNPDYDVDAMIDAYCGNMYGPAAVTVREVVKLQIEGWENSRWPGGKMSAKNIYEISYPPATIARMKELLADARAKTASDPLLAARFAYFSAPFDAMFREADETLNAKRAAVKAPRVADAPVVDGKLDEPCWKSAAALRFINAYDREHPQVKYPTSVQAAWSDGGVTFAFRMTEPGTASLQKSRTGRDNSTLWWDDNIELLLDVTAKGQGDYYHFIITPANVIADAKGKDYGWNCDAMKVASSIEKDHWSLEVFLPFAAFPEGIKPAAGGKAQWLGNFTRHRMADSGQSGAAAGSAAEYQRLNTTYAVPSENLSDFGPIEFE